MKKALARVMLIAFSIVIIAGVMPLSANASSSSNKSKIFSYLTQELEFNSAAACGIMANIEKESNFRSNVIIRDSNGLPSGGLCMWNGGRLNNLKKYCAKNGLNYLSIEGQLSYLEVELQNSYYKHIYNYLKNVANSSQGAYNAAHYWCYYFEVPANRGSKSVQRGNTAIRSYWPVYGGKELKAPEISVAKGTTYEPGKKLTVNWTSAGDDADGYKVYLVKKNAATGKYDYENAKMAKLGPKERSFTIKAHNMKVGSYKIYVCAFNNTTGVEMKSNVLTIKIKCEKHKYTSKITTIPTAEKAGVTTYTCSVCGKVKEKELSYRDYISDAKVKNVRITGITENKIKVRWDKFKDADGYRIYVKNGKAWKNIGVVSADQDNAFMVRGLESNTEYTFKVKAYVVIGDERVYTTSSNVATAKTNKATPPAEAPAEKSAEEPTAAPADTTPEDNSDDKSSSGLTNILKDFCEGFLNF